MALDSPAMAAPKRFPDRDSIADVRAATDGIDAGARARRDETARRSRHGAARDGEARLPRSGRPLGTDPAHVRHGPDRRRRRASRRRRRSIRKAREVEARRAVARRRRADGARAEPQPAARHVPRPHRHGDALPQALPRPADERGRTRAVPPAHEGRLVDPAGTSTPRASSRWRRLCCSLATAARSRTRSSRARTSSTPISTCGSRPSCTSSGSSSEGSSACTRSARISATRASRTSTSPSSRCSSGTRRTPTSATRWIASRRCSSRSRSTRWGRRSRPSAGTRST